jgi:hypothetical protein
VRSSASSRELKRKVRQNLSRKPPPPRASPPTFHSDALGYAANTSTRVGYIGATALLRWSHFSSRLTHFQLLRRAFVPAYRPLVHTSRLLSLAASSDVVTPIISSAERHYFNATLILYNAPEWRLSERLQGGCSLQGCFHPGGHKRLPPKYFLCLLAAISHHVSRRNALFAIARTPHWEEHQPARGRR